jgi:hypothetical protein
VYNGINGTGAITTVNGDAGPDVVLDAVDVGAATTAQGVLADSAVQPGDLATVATSGSASDITTGTLPTSVLPPLAITDVTPVASQAAMLALTAQRGDVAVRTDLDPAGWFILATDSPTTLADWLQFAAVGSIVTVNGHVGPAVVLVATDIDGLAAVATSGNAYDLDDFEDRLSGLELVYETHGVSVEGNFAAFYTTDGKNILDSGIHPDDLEPSARAVNTQTGNYTLVLADRIKVVQYNSASAGTFTIPPNVFPTGTYLEFTNINTGDLTLAPGAGVTLNSPAGLKITDQHGTAGARHRGSNVWTVMGRTST